MARSRLHLTLTATAVALALTLSACASDTAAEGPDDDATSAPTSAPAVTPTATPTPTKPPEPASCTNLLDEATIDSFDGMDGWQFFPDYAPWDDDPEASISHFHTYGGVACMWGYPNSDVNLIYAYSPITPGSMTEREALLESLGYDKSEESNGLLYSTGTEPGGYPEYYLFGDGYWAFASDSITLDEIVGNAPAF